MKNFILLVGAILTSISLMGQDVYTEDFNTDTSGDWTKAGDPMDEASISWSATGGDAGSGALVLSGTNTDGVNGRGFIFEVINSGIDFTDVTDVQLQFDLKTDGALVGTAVHLRTNFPGAGFAENFDLQTQGLNDATFTSYALDFSSISGGASESFTYGFVLAVGAGLDFGGSLLVENVRLVDMSGGGGSSSAFPVDFEDDGAPYTFGDFGGGTSTIIDNPDASGINMSAKVAQMEKFAGETFGGTTLTLDANIDYAEGQVFKMKVWASREVPVTFKLEQGGDITRIVNHTGS
ncbi:MAG: hypothetical protein RLO81_10665, partial [Fulvivirga sp.]